MSRSLYPTARKFARQRYNNARSRARGRGIPFEFTFYEWDQWWLEHGVDKNQRQGPYNRDTLVMARLLDQGPYAWSNVYCTTCAGNTSDWNRVWGADLNTGPDIGHTGRRVRCPQGEFVSARQAAQHMGCDATTIIRRIRVDPVNYSWL